MTLQDSNGATTLEYALMAALILLVAVAGVAQTGTSCAEVFMTGNNAIAGVGW